MDIANAEDKEEEPVFRNEEDLSVNVMMDQSLQNRKNPMLLSPVIRCVLKFLNIKDIKNCRLVSREWGSTGKLALAKRAIISVKCFDDDKQSVRRPGNFHSWFLNSASLFSAFKISYCSDNSPESYSWTIKELTKFFDKQQKNIKELTLKFTLRGEFIVKRFDLSSWISKSPLVQKNVRHMTKLVIEDRGTILDIPLHLIAHIKDLTLTNCKINLEEGIKICPIKLELDHVTFHQDGIKLDCVLINDIVDLSKAKEVALCYVVGSDDPKYAIDLSGNFILEKLILVSNIAVLNGETSQWVIEHLETTLIPYSLNNQMKIKELSLSYALNIDLFTLPNSIQNLALDLDNNPIIHCSQPIVFENLQYLSVNIIDDETDCSFLSHFTNCPQLSFLRLTGEHESAEKKSLWMPKNIKTLTLEGSLINWIDDISHLNLEKIVVRNACYSTDSLKKLCRAKIRVNDVVVNCSRITVDEDLVDLLKLRERFSFGNRFFIGKVDWEEKQLKNCVLKEHVDVKSSFYVFENGEKGRAISEKSFYELMPKHMEIEL